MPKPGRSFLRPRMPAMTDAHSSAGIAPPARRLPEATRPGRVRLQVADLARSLAFYEGLLGLHVLDRLAGRLVLGAQGDDRPLIELEERPGVQPVPRRGRLGLYHFALLLPERGALGRFIRHLGDAGLQPGMSDHRVSEAVYLRDPDGLGLEVYADRPRAAWNRDAEGQIEMATEPLDVKALLDAAGAATWSGLPAGTVVGHVHLHVGSLEQATAFYHEALGFDKVVWNYRGALFLSAGGYHHHLGLNVWARGASPAGAEEAQLLEWTLVLPGADDVAAAARSLQAAGYPVDCENEACRVTDPWGIRLCLTPA